MNVRPIIDAGLAMREYAEPARWSHADAQARQRIDRLGALRRASPLIRPGFWAPMLIDELAAMVELAPDSLLLAGGAEPTNQQVEVLLSSALEACESYFQAFQFVVWSGVDAHRAVEAVMFETVGEA